MSSYVIELKRGLKANLPATGTHVGEPYFCTDTNELFIWDGSQMAPVGGGNAAEINGVAFTNTNPSLGKIPIAQGDGTAAWADPLVQGLSAEGSAASGIQPVLVSGKGADGNTHDVSTDNTGNVNVNVQGTAAVSAASLPLPANGAQETGGNLAAAKADLDTLAGTVSSGKVGVVSSIATWGGQNVDAAKDTAPSGAEYAPVVRSLDFKSSQIVQNGAVGASSTTNSGWQDSQATGAMYAETTAICSVPSPALVQSDSNYSASSIAFPSSVTKGNLLVAYCTQDVTVSDSLGNSWASRASAVSYGPHVYTAIANASGACTVNFSGASGATIVAEFSGVDTVDASASNSAASGTTLASGSTASTAYPVELVVNFFLATSALTESAGDSATLIAARPYSGGEPSISASYKVTSAQGTQSANGTQTAGGIWFAACLVFYSSANAITGTTLGLQETDDTTNSLATSTFASAPITSALAPFTAQGTISKRYYRSFLSTGPAVNVEQTLTSSSETPELLDLSGNQKFIDGAQFQAGTAWSSATPINSTQTLISGSGVPCIVVQLNQSIGSFSAGAVTFEGTRDGQSWATIPGDILFDPTSLTAAPNPYTLTSGVNKAFLLQTTGYVAIRLRLSTAITGTGTVTPYINTTSYDPLPLNSGIYNATPPALADGQAGALQLSPAGAQYIAPYVAKSAAQKFVPVKNVSVTAGTPVVIWTPASGKKFRVVGWCLSLSVTGSILLEDASGTEFLRIPVPGNSPDLKTGYLSSAANNALYMDVTASGAVSGFVFGNEE